MFAYRITYATQEDSTPQFAYSESWDGAIDSMTRHRDIGDRVVRFQARTWGVGAWSSIAIPCAYQTSSGG